jgi:hypothetical protein
MNDEVQIIWMDAVLAQPRYHPTFAGGTEETHEHQIEMEHLPDTNLKRNFQTKLFCKMAN